MHFEEVICSEVSPTPEIEYMVEDEEAVSMSSSDSSVGTLSESVQWVKRTVPIIRKPAKIVTPIRVQAMSDLKVVSSTPRPTLTARVKPERTKVEAPAQALSLATAVPTLDNSNRKRKAFFDRDVESAFASKPASQHAEQTQMDRIEQKMDEILTRLEQHETAFLRLKNSITDLKMELKSWVTQHKDHNGKQSEDSIQDANPTDIDRPLRSADRERLVVFPVADDNYLLRLEELVGKDDDIEDALISLFTRRLH